MRVFWPTDCFDETVDSERCLFVGWRNEDADRSAGRGGEPSGDVDVVVVTALPYLSLHLVAQLLDQDGLLGGGLADAAADRAGASRAAYQLYARFQQKRVAVVGASAALLAELRATVLPRCAANSRTAATVRKLISVEMAGPVRRRGRARPAVRARSGAGGGAPCLVVSFVPPDPRRMHYFSLERARLFEPRATPAPSPAGMSLRAELAFHAAAGPPRHDNWDQIIAQLNCVHDLQITLRENARCVFPELRRDPHRIKDYTLRSPPPQTGGGGGTRSGSSSGNGAGKGRGKGRRRRSFAVVQSHVRALQLTMMARSVFEVLLQLLETACFRGMSLRSLFCTAQQLDLRLNQLCYLPLEYIAITKRSQQDWHWLTPDRNEAYIRFNNFLWLGANDFILGSYLCSLIQAHQDELAQGATALMDALCTESLRITRWLMTWPAGLKLNTRLAAFMGEITIWIILAWRSCLAAILGDAALRAAVQAVALSGVVGGATLQLSLATDLFSVFSFHLYVLYQMLARVFFQQQRVLLSLFQVFRGRKYNRLRHRVDAGDFDVNQLLLGTILFSVVLFLLPTVLAFYAVFALARVGVLSIVGVLCMGLAFLNHFPLFPLLLRVKSPNRVPSGIRFEIVPAGSGKPSSDKPSRGGGELHMKTQPMQLSEIFSQYRNAVGLFTRDILSLKLLQELCTGETVKLQQSKLYASLYSMLPGRRGSIEQLRAELSSYFELKDQSRAFR